MNTSLLPVPKTLDTALSNAVVSNTGSCHKYTVTFIPGSMGLDLEPVITSSQSLVGCKVKDFYFGLDHTGIPPAELLEQVKLGDVIDTVNGTCVLAHPFQQVINMLLNLKSTHRQIVFKRFVTSEDDDPVFQVQRWPKG